VGTYAYVNPVVAVALGTVFLGETLSARTIFAAAIILAAVAIIVTARSRLPTVPADDAADEPADGGADARPSSPVLPGSAAVRRVAPPRAPSG
jgi:hypothetical protein